MARRRFIGPIEKGIKAMKFNKPPEGIVDGVDLRLLPKYICFKAAHLKTKVTMSYVMGILVLLLMVVFSLDRLEINSLYKQLREKEYILAPGVVDFTPASPQSVSDSYLQSAVLDLLSQLGNINPINIEEQYRSFSNQMSPELKVRFLAQTVDWILKVKAESITETLTISEKQIQTNEQGFYKVVAVCRRDTYVNNEHLGFSNEVIEMIIQLMPPKREKRWYLQINSLIRSDMDTYKSKMEMQTE